MNATSAITIPSNKTTLPMNAMDSSDPTLTIVAIYIHSSTTALASIEAIAFCVYLFLQNQPPYVTPTNTALLTAFLSVIGAALCTATGLAVSRVLTRQREQQFLSNFFLSTFEFVYIQYHWRRSHKIIKLSFPGVYSFSGYLVKAAPLIIYLQLVPEILNFIWVDNSIIIQFSWATEFLGGCFIITCDLIFGITFIKFLSRTHITGERLQPDFLLIAQHGIVSSTLLLLMMILSVTAIVLPTVDHLNVCVSVIGIFMNLIVTVLVSMKLGLQRIQTRDSASVRIKPSGQFGGHKSEVVPLTIPRESSIPVSTEQNESSNSYHGMKTRALSFNRHIQK